MDGSDHLAANSQARRGGRGVNAPPLQLPRPAPRHTHYSLVLSYAAGGSREEQPVEAAVWWRVQPQTFSQFSWFYSAAAV